MVTLEWMKKFNDELRVVSDFRAVKYKGEKSGMRPINAVMKIKE